MIRAAFVGIDRHSDSRVRDLSGAARDAAGLWALLSDSIAGLNPRLITDNQATHAAVFDALDATLGVAEADDIVLLSFAGHGTRDHRLVLHDTNVDDLPATTIAMEMLAERFRTTRARTVVLILDCCFSGAAPGRVLDFGVAVREIEEPLANISGQGRVLLAASSPDQYALEDPQSRHGLFTKAIIDSLLAAEGPVPVATLVASAFESVQAAAQRMGYQQTPAMFGYVEGDFSFPRGVRGECFRAQFPELSTIRTAGDFNDLVPSGIDQSVLTAWSEQFPNGLNALQVAAINDFNVLGGNSLLVVAPTSAGKTFVGELAAIKAISDGKKAVFLLPYKALVNEKFEDFSALYGERLGLRVARCSGDWQDQVGEVMRGKYDIAFFTYEKFLGLLSASPYLLNQVGLVVLDEAQFITDPSRGIVIELLLTSLVNARNHGVTPQLIALSAVIGGTNHFESWLGCSLLRTDARPVPLRTGVVDRTGNWEFLADDGRLQQEELVSRHEIRVRGTQQSSQDVLIPLVSRLVASGEKVIIFRNQRGAASGCAGYLSRSLGLQPARSVLDQLPAGDPSVTSQLLRDALAGGVAFHNADLTREERVAVERGFRAADGQVKVLVATSTVAAGINTPASTVIIVETEFPGVVKTPYTVATFRNMAGRAGRLGYEQEGKAMAVAGSPVERNALLNRYILGQPEAIHSSFNEGEPGTWVIRLLSQVKVIARTQIVDLLANTYGGYLATRRDPNWPVRMAPQLERLIDEMVQLGLLEEVYGGVQLTMLGRACGESPLTLASALRAVSLVRHAPHGLTLEALLMLAEALPERDADYTPQVRGPGESGWQREAAMRFGADFSRLLRHQASSDREYYARCKRALIVSDWIAGRSVSEIETRYSSNAFSRVGHGDIRGYADGSRLPLDSVLRIAAIVLEHEHDPEDAQRLYKRLELGIPIEALGLVHSKFSATRGEILALTRGGITTFAALAAAPIEHATRVVGARAEHLQAIAARTVG